jgi:hypothetical protein
MTNLFLTMLDRMAAHAEMLGDCAGNAMRQPIVFNTGHERQYA